MGAKTRRLFFDCALRVFLFQLTIVATLIERKQRQS